MDDHPSATARGGKERLSVALPLDVSQTMGAAVAAVAQDLGISNQAAGRLLMAAGLSVWKGGAARLLAMGAETLKAS